MNNVHIWKIRTSRFPEDFLVTFRYITQVNPGYCKWCFNIFQLGLEVDWSHWGWCHAIFEYIWPGEKKSAGGFLRVFKDHGLNVMKGGKAVAGAQEETFFFEKEKMQKTKTYENPCVSPFLMRGLRFSCVGGQTFSQVGQELLEEDGSASNLRSTRWERKDSPREWVKGQDRIRRGQDLSRHLLEASLQGRLMSVDCFAYARIFEKKKDQRADSKRHRGGRNVFQHHPISSGFGLIGRGGRLSCYIHCHHILYTYFYQIKISPYFAEVQDQKKFVTVFKKASGRSVWGLIALAKLWPSKIFLYIFLYKTYCTRLHTACRCIE